MDKRKKTRLILSLIIFIMITCNIVYADKLYSGETFFPKYYKENVVDFLGDTVTIDYMEDEQLRIINIEIKGILVQKKYKQEKYYCVLGKTKNGNRILINIDNIINIRK